MPYSSTTQPVPSARRQSIDRLLASLEFFEGSAPVLPVGDTLARVGDTLSEPVDRTGLARVQTPQAFRLAALRSAYDRWQGPPPTDETTVMRAAGWRSPQSRAIPRSKSSPFRQTSTAPSNGSPAGFARAPAWASTSTHSPAKDPIMLGGVEIPHQPRARRPQRRRCRAPCHHRRFAWRCRSRRHRRPLPAYLICAGGAPHRRSSSHMLLDWCVKKARLIDHIDCTVIAEAPKVGPHRAGDAKPNRRNRGHSALSRSA